MSVETLGILAIMICINTKGMRVARNEEDAR